MTSDAIDHQRQWSRTQKLAAHSLASERLEAYRICDDKVHNALGEARKEVFGLTLKIIMLLE
ncbi:unnamed protein product [Cuscuta europaea]|uniref:Uncharacterized protein n=1 Tax=Cuscuta europaea TaxID=41803 RepID=A0A9P0YVL7_CUSEU|nr:unnamed protein product [Cuscuta europaea]